MSRGLGRLQRGILATLDPARATLSDYEGGADESRVFGQPPGTFVLVMHRGAEFFLPPDVYDLRASCRYLAVVRELAYRDGKAPSGGIGHIGQTRESFKATFSRAAHNLVQRGEICWVEPQPWRPYRWMGRPYDARDPRNIPAFGPHRSEYDRPWQRVQIRFVTVPSLSANESTEPGAMRTTTLRANPSTPPLASAEG